MRITIRARTGGLPYADWNLSQGPTPALPALPVPIAATLPDLPAWYVRQPDFIRKWLAFHLNRLVPRPRTHEGAAQVIIPGASPVKVQVTVRVLPSAWRVRLGWLLAIILLALEISLLLGPLVFLIILSIFG